jgi:hypothetical protein
VEGLLCHELAHSVVYDLTVEGRLPLDSQGEDRSGHSPVWVVACSIIRLFCFEFLAETEFKEYSYPVSTDLLISEIKAGVQLLMVCDEDVLVFNVLKDFLVDLYCRLKSLLAVDCVPTGDARADSATIAWR